MQADVCTAKGTESKCPHLGGGSCSCCIDTRDIADGIAESTSVCAPPGSEDSKPQGAAIDVWLSAHPPPLLALVSSFRFVVHRRSVFSSSSARSRELSACFRCERRLAIMLRSAWAIFLPVCWAIFLPTLGVEIFHGGAMSAAHLGRWCLRWTGLSRRSRPSMRQTRVAWPLLQTRADDRSPRTVILSSCSSSRHRSRLVPRPGSCDRRRD